MTEIILIEFILRPWLRVGQVFEPRTFSAPVTQLPTQQTGCGNQTNVGLSKTTSNI